MKQNIDKEIITLIKNNNLVLKMFIYQVNKIFISLTPALS